MKKDLIQKLARVRSDGGTRPLPADRLVKIKDEFTQLCSDAGNSVNDRRSLAEDIRYNRWDNQSPDGKKHDTAERPAFPFNGASDARIRLTDGTVNEQVMILMAALMRANLVFTGGGVSAETGDQLSALWSHILGNQLGAQWFVEWTKAAQWRQGDSPGAAFMQIWWQEDVELEAVTLTAEEFAQRFVELATAELPEEAMPPELALEVQAMLQDPEMREVLAGALLALYPEMPEARAAKCAAALQEDGQAEFPYPRTKDGRLCVKARRLFDDLFLPENTPTDLQRGRMIFVREWMTEVELRERDARGEYKPGFVAEVLKHEGESAWRHHGHYDDAGNYSDSVITRDWDKSRQRGLYEIVTVFYRAVNDDGIPGIYSVDYHHAVPFAGTDETLQNYKTGKYIFIPCLREIIANNFWQSRGICELGATEQQSLKLLHDSFMDHAQLCTVPPIKVPASRPKVQLVIGPLKEIKEVRPGEISFMTMAQYPQSNDKVQRAILEHHDRYFGRFSATNPPDLVRLYGQHLVDFFLLEVNEAVRMGLQIALQFMSDEQLAEIWGEDAPAVAKDIRSIQGLFKAELSFQAGMLQFDYLKEIGSLISSYVLSWDTESTVRRGELVQWFMSAISPQLARRVLRPVEEANTAEIQDEENNFAKIAAGVEPPMQTSGQDYQLRLDTLLGIGEANPEAIAKLSPTSRAILEARIQHLQGQVEQQKNKIIGRTMARPALEQAAA